MWIPGLLEIMGNDSLNTLHNGIFLLIGPKGIGKTMYCRQFFKENLQKGEYCIYVSLDLAEKQFKRLFLDESCSNIDNYLFLNPNMVDSFINNANFKHIRPYYSHDLQSELDSKLDYYSDPKINRNQLELLKRIIQLKIESVLKNAREEKDKRKSYKSNSFIIVVDSITHFLALYKQDEVIKFFNDLVFILKEAEATAIFTFDTPSTLDPLNQNFLFSIVDGILEMQFEYEKGIDNTTKRRINLSSLNGRNLDNRWIDFQIDSMGILSFQIPTLYTCTLCKKEIQTSPKFYQELAFHDNHYEVYIKLQELYGSDKIADIGVSTYKHGNFFFVDIVGLSNPNLAVRKQIEKIEILNKIISSSVHFKSISDKKVLPTGDGMVIGYLTDQELPLKLSIEVHQELRRYNRKVEGIPEAKIEIRIGLASGPVFIVHDVNNNQNIWGPGIVLARRVMDLADTGHILLESNIAESLISLDDKYKNIIHSVGDYEIKHGSILKLYSAYADGFGNSIQPNKIINK